MGKTEIKFVAAFGRTDSEVHLSYISGIFLPTYRIYLGKKEVGSIVFMSLTFGGRPEKWVCKWGDKYIDLFTSTDCQILIDIASKHYEKNKEDLYRTSH